jgi:site-specific recombinase XerD
MVESLLSPDLPDLVESWEISLVAANKSPTTVSSYLRGVNLYLRWCREGGHPLHLTRAQVQRYMAELTASGKEANTVRLRQASLRAFARWLVEEDELAEDPLLGLKPPKLPTKVVEALTDDQLRELIKACKGATFRHKRDEALVRLLSETGLRASECLAMTMADVDLKRGMVTVRRGKGGKGRVAPFSPQAAAALDRYLRARRSHKLAATPSFWLGAHNKGFAYHGLNDTLRDRAKTAGISNFHLHLLRHTAATRWLAAGGSEGGLMAVAGWSNRSMMDRYVGASAAERAAVEARSLGLGDL